ncbi:MAG: hypothetical protein GY832_36455 [Chloroflexi bacterium]|nr:hypothetical protein [Chloroflexota bacterium]
MLILVVGAKGGVGTTSLALHLTRELKAIGLDAADGQLAAHLERKTWTLAGLAFSAGNQRQNAIDRIVKQRISLLWTPECDLAGDSVWDIVQAIADRTTIIADGGITPLPQIAERANAILIASAWGNPVSAYHERKLKQQFPGASVVSLNLAQSRTVTRDTARELAANLAI